MTLKWNLVARHLKPHAQWRRKMQQKISKLEQHLVRFRPDAVFNFCEALAGESRLEPVVPLVLERMGVVLPMPFRPRSATTCPSGTPSVTPWRTSALP